MPLYIIDRLAGNLSRGTVLPTGSLREASKLVATGKATTPRPPAFDFGAPKVVAYSGGSGCAGNHSLRRVLQGALRARDGSPLPRRSM